MKEYYLGLDMGTSSVGWAVTDRNYRLLKVKGKDLWGIREFDEALPAADRRSKRISRRRRQRETVRIGLLKDYFHDVIMEKDALFFQRLENSKYHLEDKEEQVRNKNGIFNDSDYKDKDYFAQFPTIYHLRSELIHNTTEHDVRLVYLALLNMFKHRGHFLNAGLSGEGSDRKLKDVYLELCNLLTNEIDITFIQDVNIAEVEDILGNREYSKSKKAEKLASVLGVEQSDKKRMAYLKVMCGLKVNVTLLFEDLVLEEDKKIEICFSDFGYDEKCMEIQEGIGEHYYSIVELLKEIYDIGTLAGIMKGYSYLSDARIADYEKHNKDLKLLKKVFKKYLDNESYDNFFRKEESGSYSAYVNSTNTGKKIRRNVDGRKVEDLYKTIKKLLKSLPEEDADIKYIVDEMNRETFLPKQLTASNGVIPNQVHAKEMKKILNNAIRYLPFLNEKDESGLTTAERILKLFTFQIPYYVGPISINSKTGWVIRKESGEVLPWNIDEKIDMKKTSEEFISRMVRRCSYINGERVLPKASLEYESFCVLNEINNIRVKGEKISESLKQDIYNVLFKKGKKVTRKQLVRFLNAEGVLKDETELSGIDITINSSLSTYGKFKAIFGEKIEEDSYKRMIEDIVFWCTVYGDSKKFLKEQLEEHYKDKLSGEQIKRIMGFKFKDWGRLSKEFLEMRGCEKAIGESISLIRMMWEKNLNLMELLNSPEYNYKEEFENRQTKALKSLADIKVEDLEDYYFSAPVKRMVWQTLLIIKELEEILGAPPKRLFLEMTRKNGEKNVRTISRKKKLLDLYKNIKEEERDWKGEIDKADENGMLRSKKMYLYYMQMGRCMYTGESIELDKLFTNLYDIDHIYPRHFVKDDSLENNLVLVKKQTNAHKSDTYPLEENIYKSQKETWKSLFRMNLINEEKYNRLTRRTPFTDEDKAGFIARQLVETSQGTKGVAELLKQLLPEPQTKIIYSKASNVSEFRQSRKLAKCRSVNDFHHAHDAYLNIVVGNVYFTKFTQNPMNFIKKEYAGDKEKYRYNLSRMFDWDVVRDGEVAWIGSKKDETSGTIVTVKETLAKNTPLMTRMNFEGHGGIANETLYSAKKASAEKYIPLKTSDIRMQDVTKYGGFTSVSTAYFFLVEHELKKKTVRTLETVPIYMKEKVDGNLEELKKYCIEGLGLINPSIRMPKIKIQSLIKKDGYFMHLSGKTGNQIILRNAVNLCLKQEWMQYVKKLEKYSESQIISEEFTKEKNIDLYLLLLDKHQNSIYAKRPNPVGEKLCKAKEIFEQLEIGKQCDVLNQILKLTAIGTTSADLSLIKEASLCGKMLMPKKISDAEDLFLINQSVTGIFESRIDLLIV